MPSPVMFGSLSTGVLSDHPWQTLLFRPLDANLPGGLSHPGGQSPRDHLLLDLFWMPVVEPYPISEPFSTAGKINLNSQIAPFTTIIRNTGLLAAMKAVKITALNPDAPAGTADLIACYKTGGRSKVANPGSFIPAGTAYDVSVRYPIDAEETLKQVHTRFAANKPFLSASEICDLFLVPKGIILSGISTFWSNNKLTGDNSLERPYVHLYPRLTTKSNTFTVHTRIQTLTMTPDSAVAGEFNSARDRIGGEFRGSFVIERYLDPNVQTYDPNRAGGLGPYKMRVISSKQISL